VSSIELPIGFPANFEAGVIEPNNSEGFWPKLDNRVEVENYKTKNVVTVSSGWSSKQIFERFIESNFKPVTDTKDQETTFHFTESGAIFNRKERPEGQSHVLTVLRGMGSVQGEASKLLELGIDF